jgi:hypothetical protein
VLYRSETKDGDFEEAYRLCPKGHAPRYCMGSSSTHLCPLPATRRLGPGYYCEARIEHSLYKALRELQHLQAARRADDDAPPPVAIDVDVSGVSRDGH